MTRAFDNDLFSILPNAPLSAPEFSAWGFSAEDGMEPLCAWCGTRTSFEHGQTVCRSETCRYRVLERD